MVLGMMGNLGKPAFRELLPGLIDELNRRGTRFVLDEAVAEGLDLPAANVLPASEIPEAATMILSFGGDGTLLRTARIVGQRHTPVLGVNTGPGLGYLTELGIHDLHGALDRILSGGLRTENRMMLTASVERDSTDCCHALNDIVVGHSQVSRTLHLELLIDHHPVAMYRCDGLIISTPTGSTAYSLSVGGPIVEPKLNAIIVSPISPHTLTLRPVVISDDRVIEIRPKNSASLAADGETMRALDVGDVVRVRRSTFTTAIVNITGHDFYHVLRTKLHWGKGTLSGSRRNEP
jgi:NAD+ kinase